MKIDLVPVAENPNQVDLSARLDFASEKIRFETKSHPGAEWSCRFRLRAAELTFELSNLESPREARAHQNGLPIGVDTEVQRTSGAQQSKQEKRSKQSGFGVKKGMPEAGIQDGSEAGTSSQADRGETINYNASHFAVQQKGPTNAPCWEIDATPLPALRGHLDGHLARIDVIGSPNKALARLEVARGDVVIDEADLVSPAGAPMSPNRLAVILLAIQDHISEEPLCEQGVTSNAR